MQARACGFEVLFAVQTLQERAPGPRGGKTERYTGFDDVHDRLEIGVNRERLGMPADRIEVAREPQQRAGPDGSIRGGGEASICRDGARSIAVLELEHVDAAKRFGGYSPQRGEHRQERDSAGATSTPAAENITAIAPSGQSSLPSASRCSDAPIVRWSLATTRSRAPPSAAGRGPAALRAADPDRAAVYAQPEEHGQGARP